MREVETSEISYAVYGALIHLEYLKNQKKNEE